MSSTRRNLTNILQLIENEKEEDNINEGEYLSLCNTMKVMYEKINFNPELCPYSNELMVKVGLRTCIGIKYYNVPKGFFQTFVDTEAKRCEMIDTLKASNESLKEALVKNQKKLNEVTEKLRKDLVHRTPKKIEDEDIDGKVECKHCGSFLAPTSLKAHYKTKKCKKARRDARQFIRIR